MASNEQLLQQLQKDITGIDALLILYPQIRSKFAEQLAKMEEARKLLQPKKEVEVAIEKSAMPTRSKAEKPKEEDLELTTEQEEDNNIFTHTFEVNFLPNAAEIRNDKSGEMIDRQFIDIIQIKDMNKFELPKLLQLEPERTEEQYSITLATQKAKFTSTKSIKIPLGKTAVRLSIKVVNLSPDSFIAEFKDDAQKVRTITSSLIMKWQGLADSAIEAKGDWWEKNLTQFYIETTDPELDHDGPFYQTVMASTSSALVMQFLETKTTVSNKNPDSLAEGLVKVIVGFGGKLIKGGLPGMFIGIVVDVIVNTFLADSVFADYGTNALRKQLIEKVGAIKNSIISKKAVAKAKIHSAAINDNSIVNYGRFNEHIIEATELLKIYEHYTESCTQLSALAAKLKGDMSLCAELKRLAALSKEEVQAEEQQKLARKRNDDYYAVRFINERERGEANLKFIVAIENYLLDEMGISPCSVTPLEEWVYGMKQKHYQGEDMKTLPEKSPLFVIDSESGAIINYQKLGTHLQKTQNSNPYGECIFSEKTPDTNLWQLQNSNVYFIKEGPKKGFSFMLAIQITLVLSGEPRFDKLFWELRRHPNTSANIKTVLGYCDKE